MAAAADALPCPTPDDSSEIEWTSELRQVAIHADCTVFERTYKTDAGSADVMVYYVPRRENAWFFSFWSKLELHGANWGRQKSSIFWCHQKHQTQLFPIRLHTIPGHDLFHRDRVYLSRYKEDPESKQAVFDACVEQTRTTDDIGTIIKRSYYETQDLIGQLFYEGRMVPDPPVMRAGGSLRGYRSVVPKKE